MIREMISAGEPVLWVTDISIVMVLIWCMG